MSKRNIGKYWSKVTPDEAMVPEGQVWFLPHFPVCRPDRGTTKTRIVFDASAKHRGVSLNEMILPGPKLLSNLFDVLMRFRRYPVAVACDIREMYLQIRIPAEDRSYFRFLWRDLEIDPRPDVYEFERVVFGDTSAPFRAQFVAQENVPRTPDGTKKRTPSRRRLSKSQPIWMILWTQLKPRRKQSNCTSN